MQKANGQATPEERVQWNRLRLCLILIAEDLRDVGEMSKISGWASPRLSQATIDLFHLISEFPVLLKQQVADGGQP